MQLTPQSVGSSTARFRSLQWLAIHSYLVHDPDRALSLLYQSLDGLAAIQYEWQQALTIELKEVNALTWPENTSSTEVYLTNCIVSMSATVTVVALRRVRSRIYNGHALQLFATDSEDAHANQ